MLIAQHCKCIPEKHWNCNSTLNSKNGLTTAMNIARYCK